MDRTLIVWGNPDRETGRKDQLNAAKKVSGRLEEQDHAAGDGEQDIGEGVGTGVA